MLDFIRRQVFADARNDSLGGQRSRGAISSQAGRDVDFMVEFAENPTSLVHICGFRETVSELLKLDVDIVKLSRKPNDGLTVDRTVRMYGA